MGHTFQIGHSCWACHLQLGLLELVTVHLRGLLSEDRWARQTDWLGAASFHSLAYKPPD